MPRMDAQVDACRFMQQQCEKKCEVVLLQQCSSLASPGAGWFGVVMRCGSRSANTVDLIESVKQYIYKAVRSRRQQGLRCHLRQTLSSILGERGSVGL